MTATELTNVNELVAELAGCKSREVQFLIETISAAEQRKLMHISFSTEKDICISINNPSCIVRNAQLCYETETARESERASE